MVLPMLAGEGRRVTPDVDAAAPLTFLESRPWPGGVVELVYAARTGKDAAGPAG